MLDARLTQKAKSALILIPEKKTVSAKVVLQALKDVNGLGSYILNTNKKIRVTLSKRINLDKLLIESYYHALKFQHPYVGTEHLLLALLSLTSDKSISSVKSEIARITLFPNIFKNYEKDANFPIIETYGRDLNKEAIHGAFDNLVEREEYSSLISSLLLKNSNNVLIIGDKGVGKRTLINLLAKNINIFNTPPQIAGYRVLEFDLMSFLMNSINKVGVDNSLISLSNELRNYGRTVLYIKNFQNLFFSTSSGVTMPMFYSLFKSALSENDVKIVATVTTGLYEKITSENDHIVEDFTIIEVPEPDDKETMRILKATLSAIENFHGVSIPVRFLNYIYKRTKNQLLDTKFPQKGIDILDYIGAFALVKKSKFPKSYKKLIESSYSVLKLVEKSLDEKNYDAGVVAREGFLKIDSLLTSKEQKIVNTGLIPVTLSDIKEAFSTFEEEMKIKPQLTTNINTKLVTLSERVKTQIIGQDKAIDVVVNTLVRSKLGLRTRKRPLGNFLFLGPTGVGKTELAKVLSKEFYGDKSLIRLDMSDFSEKHTVARLVGAPPGYVGFGEGGELTSKIESNPYSVVLFDEIEKAHHDVLNILLQIMEEGELSDARGNVFDFTKSVVILTSNLGTEILHNKSIGFNNEIFTNTEIEKRLSANLKRILKPELLNRFDEIIIFSRLSEKDQERIISILMGEIINNLKTQNITLKIDRSVSTYLLEKGYSKEYGARALRRTMEKELLDKIASVLLKKTKRPLKITATVKDNSILITK